MASSSAIGSTTPLLSYVIAEKLTKTNYSLWKAHVIPILRGAQLQGYLDDIKVASDKMIESMAIREKVEATQEVNTQYIQWSVMEQQVLSFLLMSMTKKGMAQVVGCSTPNEVWTLLEQTYASRSKAWVVNICMTLTTNSESQYVNF
jgi:hypothetical protein